MNSTLTVNDVSLMFILIDVVMVADTSLTLGLQSEVQKRVNEEVVVEVLTRANPAENLADIEFTLTA